MNTSHSAQKSFEQSVHLYRPKGLIPSAPASTAAPPVPLAELALELPAVVEAATLDFPVAELLLPCPGSGVNWKVLAHAWQFGLEFAVSSAVILQARCEVNTKFVDPVRRHSHRSVSFNGEQMVITPRQVWGAHDHQPAHVAVRWYVAHFGGASWTEEPLRLHLGMADA